MPAKPRPVLLQPLYIRVWITRGSIRASPRGDASGFGVFPAERGGRAWLVSRPYNEFAKRPVAHVEAIICQAFPYILPRLSGRKGGFNRGKEPANQRGFRAGRFGSEFFQLQAEAIFD